MPEMGTVAGKQLGSNMSAGIVGGLTSAGKDGAKSLDKGITDGIAKAAPGWRQSLADGLLSGMAQNGEKAANTFRGQFVTGIARGLEPAMRDTGVKGGKALSDGFGSGLSGIGGKFQTASGALTDLGIDADLATSKIGGIGGALGAIVSDPVVLAGAAVLAVVAGVGVLTDKLNELGEKWETTWDRIQIKTGDTGEKLAAVEDSVKRVAGTVGLDIGKISDIASAVSVNLNQTGPGLDTVTQAVGRLDNVLAKAGEAPVNLLNLGRTFSGFGIKDADGQVTALDQLLQAQQATQIPMNTLTETMQKAGAGARALGLDYGQTAGLLAQFSQGGGDPAKVVLGLSKAAQEAIKTHVPLKEFLADTVTQIKALSDAGKTDAATKLAETAFGPGVRGAGLPIVEDIQKGIITADTLKKGLTDTGETVNSLYTATKHWADSWVDAKAKIETALEPISTGVHHLVDEQLSKLADWIGTHQQDIVNFFTDVAKAGAVMVEGIGKAVGGVIQIFGDLEGGVAKVARTIGDLLGGIASAVESLPSWLGGGKDNAKGIRDAADGIYGFGQRMQETSDKTTELGRKISDWATGVIPTVDALANSFGHVTSHIDELDTHIGTLGHSIDGLPKDPKIDIQVNTDDANAKMSEFVNQWKQYLSAPGAPINTPATPPTPGSLILPIPHATGGPISGPGTGISDSILLRASNGEFIVNADATRKNLPLLEIINSGKMPRYAGGGAVGSDVAAAERLVGTPYSTAKRTDCSGDVARVINGALGPNPDSPGLMTTANAALWLAARGFKPGIGGPGTISVGWKNGGPGGGHMAMTLSDGRNAEGGGSHPNFLIGDGAAGASSPQFTDHMYLALASAIGATGANGAAKGAVSGQGFNDSAAPTAAGSSSGGGGPLPSSISGLSSFGLAGLGSGIGTTGSGSDLSKFGNAAAAAVSGQVSSALGVFGVGDNPPFLQAASQLLSGIKVGGHAGPGKSDGSIFNGANPLGSFGQGRAGSSAVPLSASSTGTGTPPPDGTPASGHGSGQAPGPVFNTTISAFDTTDALRLWQSKTNQMVAAKLSTY